MKDTKCSLHSRTNWYETTHVASNACKCAQRVSGILLKRESRPGANEVRGHHRGKHYLLSTYYSSTLYYLALHCCCCCCIVCHTNKIEATEECGASRSDLQQQRSSIMMHPSGHPAARQQRCSHAPTRSRHTRSVCTSTWSVSRAWYVRACCAIVRRYAG